MVITDKSHLTATPGPKNEKISGVGFAYCMRDRRAMARRIAAAPAGSPSPTRNRGTAKAKAKNKDKKKDDKSSGTNLFGPGAGGGSSMNPQRPKSTPNEAFLIQPERGHL